MRASGPRRRGTAAVAAAALLIGPVLAGCGSGDDSSSGGTQTLTWYINPDVGNADATKGGQATLAKQCSESSGGKYKINVQLLPNSASDQRTQLLRRLAAGDTSMDLMSMDPVFVAEFAQAGYLAPVPSSMEADFREDRVQSSITASTWKGKLIAVPFWSNTQLLWYRKSAAKKAGLNMSKPVTWDQLIAGAKKAGTDIGVQAKLYEGYVVWINALIAGAGGKIVQNPGADGEDVKLGLDSAAGRDAARIISSVAKSGVGGPAMGSATETEALNSFTTKQADFLVNWPYTYASITGDKSDIGATTYPRTTASHQAAPPYGGIQLGVGAKSKHQQLSYEAAKCITSAKHQAEYMAKSGNPASRKASFKDPEVLKAFPNGLAALISRSLQQAVPRPQTQYYGDISTGIQQRWSPPSAVTQKTPATSQSFLQQVLKGKALL